MFLSSKYKENIKGRPFEKSTFFRFSTPAENRTHADYQQVANYFVTNPHLVTNSFQTGNKRLKMSSR